VIKTKRRKFLAVNAKLRRIPYVRQPFFANLLAEQPSIHPEYSFTLGDLPVAGDSYWTSKRKYAAATD